LSLRSRAGDGQQQGEAGGAKPGDVICFQLGQTERVHSIMANLRVHLGKKLGLIPESGSGGRFELLWIIDPPLFERTEDGKGWAAAHHPFTRPHDECLPLLEKDPGKVLCYRYDVVLNGFEVGGGSVRLHDPEVQARVFTAIGVGAEEAEEKFGFLLKALRHGAPPVTLVVRRDGREAWHRCRTLRPTLPSTPSSSLKCT